MLTCDLSTKMELNSRQDVQLGMLDSSALMQLGSGFACVEHRVVCTLIATPDAHGILDARLCRAMSSLVAVTHFTFLQSLVIDQVLTYIVQRTANV